MKFYSKNNSLLISLLLICNSAWAENKGLPKINMQGLDFSLLNALLGFAAVIALIYLFAYLYKKLNGLNVQHTQHLKILAGMPLGTREKLVLVQAGDKQILLGLTQHNIAALHVFDEAIIQESSPSPNQFSTLLKRFSSKLNHGGGDKP